MFLVLVKYFIEGPNYPGKASRIDARQVPMQYYSRSSEFSSVQCIAASAATDMANPSIIN
jgi:hypothetical protein